MARRTLLKYINLMSHGLGKVPDSRHPLIDTFNDAGRALFTLAEGPPHFHSWSWLLRDNLPFVLPGNNVEKVELPPDFGTFVSLQYQKSFVGRVVPTTPGELNRIRRTFNVDPLRVYICFDVGETSTNAERGPRKIAAFWPPRESDQEGLLFSYRRTWVDMDQSADTNAIPDIPAEWDRLLMLLCRAYAIHIEDQAAAAEDQQVTLELARLANYDAGKQVDKGPPMHSVMARAQRIGSWPAWYGRAIIRP